MNIFLPNRHVRSIYEVTPASLKAENKKGIIVDLDNTLIPWDVAHATEEIVAWLKEMEEAGIQVTIFSNNDAKRVTTFAKPLDIPYVYRAKKPLRRAFFQAQKSMQLKKEEMVVIGDQLMTDILGGNRAGFHTILVVPIVESDAPITTFNRTFEKTVMNYFYRKGKLTRRPK